MEKRSDTLVIIPTYNETGNLEKLLREIQALGLGLDLLVIDDNSPDGTGRLADRLSQEMPLAVIHRPGKLGIGSAHKEGFRHAITRGYRQAITMDADFSHSPRYLRPMLERSQQADVVVGSRYIPGGGLHGWSVPRLLLTHTAHLLTRVCLGIPQDCTGGFRLYQIERLRNLRFDDVKAEGYAFLMEMLFLVQRQGFTIQEIPIVINSRHHGKSKISKREIFRAVVTLARLMPRRARPAR